MKIAWGESDGRASVPTADRVHCVTVTKHTGDTGEGQRSRCAWCSRAMPERGANVVGRKPLYCRRSCRQRAFEARRRGEQLGVADDAQMQLDDGMQPTQVLERLLAAIDAVVGTN